MPSAWGKIDRDSGISHHLCHHCADVAAVFTILLERIHYQRALTKALGRPLHSTEIDALIVMAFLHDVGKLAPGFQRKGWPDLLKTGTYGHLEAGQIWLNALDDSSLGGQINALATMCGDQAEPWFDVIFAHHGRPLKPVDEARAKGCFRNFDGYDWQAEERILGEAIAKWFPPLETLRLPPPTPQLMHLVAGLLALSDWLGNV